MEFKNTVCTAGQTSIRWVTLVLLCSEVKCYMGGNMIKSIFTPNKRCLFLISEQEVMIIFVDGAQPVTGQHGVKKRLLESHLEEDG
jgi:hypothetical protein